MGTSTEPPDPLIAGRCACTRSPKALRPRKSWLSSYGSSRAGHHRDDPRAMFVYAITSRGVEHIEPTVRRIRDNGNRVTFNYYSE